MAMHVRGGMLLAVLGLISSGFTASTASAQWFSRSCQHCQRPVSHCNCQAQQPVINTHFAPQQATTMRNEVVTEYRQVAYTQNVPVTTYRDVVVDEGSYQTVYVPRPVTKRIPQITYQQQIAYRTVPVQVTRQVPQVVTQWAPQSAVPYQPTSPVATNVVSPMPMQPSFAAACACAPVMVAPCPPCGVAVVPVYPSASVHGASTVNSTAATARTTSNPVTMLPPMASTHSSSAAASESAVTPVPDPKFLDSPGAVADSWTTVGSRRGSKSSSGQTATSSAMSSGGLRFTPARTVYRQWETQSRIAAVDGAERQ